MGSPDSEKQPPANDVNQSAVRPPLSPLHPSASHLPPLAPCPSSPTLAIVGGGLAGLAAAVAAVERGWSITLFERAKMLGGRAGSFYDSTIGDLVDYSQHVAMGCCTQFLDFCRRTKIDDCFARSTRQHFIAPDGRQFDFAPSRLLPAPLHLLPGLLRLGFLSLADRLRILPAMARLVRSNAVPNDEPFLTWLRANHQSDSAIDHFWSIVVISALGETVEYASTAAAAQVFRDGFLASRAASELFVPRLPLAELFHHRVGRWLTNRGVTVRLGTPVLKIERQTPNTYQLTLGDGGVQSFDAVVTAVPWHETSALLADDLRAQMPFFDDLEKLPAAAITAVHFWFDRPVIPVARAALIGRLSQWVFAEKCHFSETSKAAEKLPVSAQHCQVVLSAAHRLPHYAHAELLAKIRDELAAIWPTVRDAQLLHSRILTQPRALFSVQPDIDPLRPPQETPLPRFALAGDWTATGWPATMEGAVRSGFHAVRDCL